MNVVLLYGPRGGLFIMSEVPLHSILNLSGAHSEFRMHVEVHLDYKKPPPPRSLQ